MRGIKEFDPDDWMAPPSDPRDVNRKTTKRGKQLNAGSELQDGCSKREPSMNYHEIERDKTGGRNSLGGNGTTGGA